MALPMPTPASFSDYLSWGREVKKIPITRVPHSTKETMKTTGLTNLQGWLLWVLCVLDRRTEVWLYSAFVSRGGQRLRKYQLLWCALGNKFEQRFNLIFLPQIIISKEGCSELLPPEVSHCCHQLYSVFVSRGEERSRKHQSPLALKF